MTLIVIGKTIFNPKQIVWLREKSDTPGVILIAGVDGYVHTEKDDIKKVIKKLIMEVR
jgi:hypothetical protein